MQMILISCLALALVALLFNFPQSDCGSILITTRDRQVGIKFATPKNVVRVSPMTDSESNALLSARLEENRLELQDGVKLSRALEEIPHALAQEISFISANEDTVAHYLELYNASDANKINLLSMEFEDDIRDSEVKNPVQRLGW